MAKIVPDESFMEKNHKKTVNLLQETFGLNSGIVNLLCDFEERYVLCPASSRREYYSCFPGGLSYHNLFVRFVMQNLAKVMSYNISEANLLKIAFLHEIGKLGTKEHEYYIPQKSDWHREKGMYYEINPDIQYMKVSQRSLFLINQYDIPLSEQEYLAILLHDGQSDSCNSSYKFKEPTLVLLLQNAVQWARKLEKENDVCWPR